MAGFVLNFTDAVMSNYYYYSIGRTFFQFWMTLLMLIDYFGNFGIVEPVNPWIRYKLVVT